MIKEGEYLFHRNFGPLRATGRMNGGPYIHAVGDSHPRGAWYDPDNLSRRQVAPDGTFRLVPLS